MATNQKTLCFAPVVLVSSRSLVILLLVTLCITVSTAEEVVVNKDCSITSSLNIMSNTPAPSGEVSAFLFRDSRLYYVEGSSSGAVRYLPWSQSATTPSFGGSAPILVTTLAGGSSSSTTFAEGSPGTAATIPFAQALALSDDGSTLYSSCANRYVMFSVATSPDGSVTKIVGTGTRGSDDSSTGTSATISNVYSMMFLPSSALLYFTDLLNHAVRRVETSGSSGGSFPVSTVLGNPSGGGTFTAGFGVNARLGNPCGLAAPTTTGGSDVVYITSLQGYLMVWYLVNNYVGRLSSPVGESVGKISSVGQSRLFSEGLYFAFLATGVAVNPQDEFLYLVDSSASTPSAQRLFAADACLGADQAKLYYLQPTSPGGVSRALSVDPFSQKMIVHVDGVGFHTLFSVRSSCQAVCQRVSHSISSTPTLLAMEESNSQPSSSSSSSRASGLGLGGSGALHSQDGSSSGLSSSVVELITTAVLPEVTTPLPPTVSSTTTTTDGGGANISSGTTTQAIQRRVYLSGERGLIDIADCEDTDELLLDFWWWWILVIIVVFLIVLCFCLRFLFHCCGGGKKKKGESGEEEKATTTAAFASPSPSRRIEQEAVKVHFADEEEAGAVVAVADVEMVEEEVQTPAALIMREEERYRVYDTSVVSEEKNLPLPPPPPTPAATTKSVAPPSAIQRLAGMSKAAEAKNSRSENDVFSPQRNSWGPMEGEEERKSRGDQEEEMAVHSDPEDDEDDKDVGEAAGEATVPSEDDGDRCPICRRLVAPEDAVSPSRSKRPGGSIAVGAEDKEGSDDYLPRCHTCKRLGVTPPPSSKKKKLSTTGTPTTPGFTATTRNEPFRGDSASPPPADSGVASKRGSFNTSNKFTSPNSNPNPLAYLSGAGPPPRSRPQTPQPAENSGGGSHPSAPSSTVQASPPHSGGVQEDTQRLPSGLPPLGSRSRGGVVPTVGSGDKSNSNHSGRNSQQPKGKGKSLRPAPVPAGSGTPLRPSSPPSTTGQPTSADSQSHHSLSRNTTDGTSSSARPDGYGIEPFGYQSPASKRARGEPLDPTHSTTPSSTTRPSSESAAAVPTTSPAATTSDHHDPYLYMKQPAWIRQPSGIELEEGDGSEASTAAPPPVGPSTMITVNNSGDNEHNSSQALVEEDEVADPYASPARRQTQQGFAPPIVTGGATTDAAPLAAEREDATNKGGAKEGIHNKIIPEGNDWIKPPSDPINHPHREGLLWSESQQLYFAEDSGHFYDPHTELWYDPDLSEWYPAHRYHTNHLRSKQRRGQN